MKKLNREDNPPRVVYLTPQGRVLNQNLAMELAKEDELILLCGHYEGFDERIREIIKPREISIGDFVLTGGELPAMVFIDTVSRFVEGVLSNDESAMTESFSDGLLEYPQYTKPAEFEGLVVPEVLRNGNHALIAEWRYQKSLVATYLQRPELLNEEQMALLEGPIPRKLNKTKQRFYKGLREMLAEAKALQDEEKSEK